MSREVTTRPWAAVLIAIVPALCAVIIVEAIQASATASGSFLGRLVATLAEVSSSGLRQLGVTVLIATACAAALWGSTSNQRRWRVIARLALVLIASVQVALVRLVAIDAPHLAGSLPVTMAFVFVAAGYGALMLWLSWADVAARARRIAGVVLAVAALIAAAAHYQFYVGLYLTLHTSVAMFAFLGAHLGLSMVWTGARFTVRRAGAFIVTPALILVAGALIPTPATARGRGHAVARSALARPVMIAETPAHLIRPSEAPRRQAAGPMRPDEEAVQRFEEAHALPRLPEELDIADLDVLMVIIDATRYDRTSLGSAELDNTPTLNSFVKRGAFSFTRAYTPSNGTFPTLASMLSMTPFSFAKVEIHDRHWHGELAQDQRTAPDALSEAGHQTFWIGFNFKRVMTIRVHGVASRFDTHHLELIWPGRDLDADARIATRAIREIRAARAAGRRYFGLVCFSSPHDDYQVHDRRRPGDTPMDRYDQEIWYADRQLRRLLDEVARGGGLSRTVVIITSDHGEAFGEHGHRYHLSSLYQEQVHVPLVIWVPGVAGETRDDPTSTLYVLPWLLLNGPTSTRALAQDVLRSDLGPLLRETDGAVVSEFISRQRQEATLRYPDYSIYYDLLADDFMIFDARDDLEELHDLHEDRPDLVERFSPVVEAYRRVRFAGQQYNFRPIVGERVR